MNNCLEMKYKNEKKIRQRIFGAGFYFKNREGIEMFVQGIKKEFHFDFESFKINDKEFVIKLIIKKKEINMNHMFCFCSSLIYVKGFSHLSNIKINGITGMFTGCKLLIDLSDIGKINTKNIIDMNNIFLGCKCLTKLNGIESWITSNVKSMKNLFYGCESLLYLPDLSKWDVSQLDDITSMFYGCKSLSFIPGIKICSKITKKERLFEDCRSLSFVPGCFFKNNEKGSEICEQFFNCISLSYFPKELNNEEILQNFKHYILNAFHVFLYLNVLPHSRRILTPNNYC